MLPAKAGSAQFPAWGFSPYATPRRSLPTHPMPRRTQAETLPLDGAPAAVIARRTRAPAAALTTAQQLGSLIKSARDIMRKDKGLSGDLDRLPALTWVMFVKFLDDMEQVRETEAALEGKRFRPAIEPPYRWRDWAARPDGVTGRACRRRRT